MARAYPRRMDLFDAVTSTTSGPARGRGGRAARGPDAAARRSTRSRARSTCSSPGSPLRRLVEPADEAARRAAPTSVVLWGPPGTGKTTLAYLIAATSGPPVRGALRGDRRGQGRARGDRGRPSAARHRRRRDRAVHRRGAPVHQGAAGRAAAERREPLGHAGGGDHREPVLLGELAAAVPLAAAHPAAAGRRRRARARAARGRRTSAGWAARSRSTRTPRTTCCGWPAATRARR